MKNLVVILIILISLMLMSLMLNSCTFWYKYVVTDKYKQKRALVESILENPDEIDSIIKNSRFYDSRFFEFDEFDEFDGENISIVETIEKLKELRDTKYEFVINNYGFYDKIEDIQGNIYKSPMIHEVGVLEVDKENNGLTELGFVISFIDIGKKWYIYDLYFYIPFDVLPEGIRERILFPMYRL